MNYYCNEEKFNEELDLLINNDPLLQRVFSSENISANDRSEAEKHWNESQNKEKFGELNEVVELYKSNKLKECNTKIYHPEKKKWYDPKILSPMKQNNRSFNVVEFLRHQQQENKMQFINFDYDQEMYEDLSYEDKKKIDVIIDYSLKSIAKIVLMLNQSRKEIPYTILDIHNENRIN